MAIEWTDVTWNPIRVRDRKTGKLGHYCELVSPGCAHCYASAFQPRFGLPRFGGPVNREARLQDLELFLDTQVLKQPFHWKKPRRIFVCSMTDLFGEWVSTDDINDVFRVMWKCQQHQFQVLTKRADRLRDYCSQRWGQFDGKDFPPAPNVWHGVSVESQQQAEKRIPPLLQTPAAVHFLSCEPLLGPLDLTRIWSPVDGAYFNAFHGEYCGLDGWASVDWVIAGGESGPQARPCDLAWLRSLRNQCRTAGVAFFCKQLGAAAHDPPNGIAGRNLHVPEEAEQLVSLRLHDAKGANPDEWPEDLRVRQFPQIGEDL